MNDHTDANKINKRVVLFNKLSKNLAIIKTHPEVNIEPDLEDTIICPICIKLFSRKALTISEDVADYLTLEDVPPIALGGKVRTLTCKVCNNTAGTRLESHLANKLRFEDAMLGLQDTAVEGTIRPTDRTKIAASISLKGKEGISIRYDPNRSNPIHVDQFLTRLKKGEIEKFSLDFHGKFRVTRPEIALIRIAYLLAFSFFGYGFILNLNLGPIRNQIQNPQEKILPHWGITSKGLAEENVGVNIIKEPKELKSFLIVFDLKTNKRVKRYGVLLPGPTDPGLNIYKWLSKLPEAQRTSNIQAVRIPDEDYIGDPKLAFESHLFWSNIR